MDNSVTLPVPADVQVDIEVEKEVKEEEERGVGMSNAAQDLESILRSYENDLNCT